MNLSPILTVACAAGLLFTAPLASAQSVEPTHTFETPLMFSPFTGQVTWSTVIAPPAGENLVSTEVLLKWTTNGTQSAAQFGMDIETLFLLTSDKCAVAIPLYRKFGFEDDAAIMDEFASAYRRCNVAMRWNGHLE
jgi:hypothetical protein